ncbi:glycerophosphodiester phosphodiesterase [Natronorarus salvus]|uniref:glycerophosphodiester phosphodiesterase n=1 Tax=Natronorarus salvus TaxID=3117733 RepID=UPI002F2617AC
MRLIAHRGFAGEHPENTLAAVRATARLADAIEIDVRRCGSGELVAFHDRNLSRLTGVRKPLAETPYDELGELSVLDSGEHVPRLEEVFEALSPDVEVIPELKEPGLLDDVVDLATRNGHDPLVSAADPGALSEARSVDGEIRRALVVPGSLPVQLLEPVVPGHPNWLYAREDVRRAIGLADRLGCEAIHPRLGLPLATDLVERAHGAGLRVEAWTATTEREFRRLRVAGVDGVIADRPFG